MEHKELAKTRMKSDSSVAKLFCNWLEEYKPFDEINLNNRPQTAEKMLYQ